MWISIDISEKCFPAFLAIKSWIKGKNIHPILHSDYGLSNTQKITDDISPQKTKSHERNYEILFNIQNAKLGIMVGSGYPHPPEFTSLQLDYRNELQRIYYPIYTILFRDYTKKAKYFFQEVADRTGGKCIEITHAKDIIEQLDNIIESKTPESKIGKALANILHINCEKPVFEFLKDNNLYGHIYTPIAATRLPKDEHIAFDDKGNQVEPRIGTNIFVKNKKKVKPGLIAFKEYK